jgi:hypothetical protein
LGITGLVVIGHGEAAAKAKAAKAAAKEEAAAAE